MTWRSWLVDVASYEARILGDRLEQRHARHLARYIVKLHAPRVLPAGTGVTTRSIPDGPPVSYDGRRLPSHLSAPSGRIWPGSALHAVRAKSFGSAPK